MTEDRNIPLHEWEELINLRTFKALETEYKDILNNAADNMTTVDDINEMCRFQGRIQALKAVIVAPYENIAKIKEESEVLDEE